MRHLLESIDSRELSEWAAFYNLGKSETKDPKKMSLDDQFKSALRVRKRKAK